MTQDIVLQDEMPRNEASSTVVQTQGSETSKSIIRRILADLEVWTTPDAEVFVTLPDGQHVPAASAEFKEHVASAYLRLADGFPSSAQVDGAVMYVKAEARQHPRIQPIYLRLAHVRENIFLDLGTANREMVKITPAGWSVIVSDAVRFRRPKGIMSMPTPVAGGSIEALRGFANVGSHKGFALVVGWLLGSFMRPIGGYPMMVLNGTKGSGKTTLARVLKDLSDPNTVALSPPPRNDLDLRAALSNCRIPAFDNISQLSDNMSDSLCRVSTGISLATRALYTDTSQVTVRAHAPIILNGIEAFGRRTDFADRSITLNLPSIPASARRDEVGYWHAYEAARPEILGALLSAVAHALAHFDETRLTDAPRLADWARWVTAGEEAFGWPTGTIVGAFQAQLTEALQDRLYADALVIALQRILEGEGDTRVFTWPELLTALSRECLADSGLRRASLPASGHQLSGALSRLKVDLPLVGWEYKPWRNNLARGAMFTRLHT